jgi:hypothetical protein
MAQLLWRDAVPPPFLPIEKIGISLRSGLDYIFFYCYEGFPCQRPNRSSPWRSGTLQAGGTTPKRTSVAKEQRPYLHCPCVPKTTLTIFTHCLFASKNLSPLSSVTYR